MWHAHHITEFSSCKVSQPGQCAACTVKFGLCIDRWDAEYRCKLAGAQRNSFPSVVAGGPDACVIHYLRNDKVHLLCACCLV